MPQNDSNKEKYTASKKDEENTNEDSSKKAAGVAAKGVINYATGGAGGKIYDAAKKVPGIGKKLDKAEEKIGKTLNKATGGKFGKAAKKADDAGALDAADKALSLNVSGPNTSNSNNLADNNASDDGLGKKDGLSSPPGLGGGKKNKKSPLDRSENENEENSSDNDGKNSDSDIGGKIAGSLLTKSIKRKLILIGVGCFLLFIPIILILSSENDTISDEEEEIYNGCGVVGNCLYNVTGFSNGANIYKTNLEISNLKVRLMKCDGSGPMPGEELVEFEKYVLGTTYQEHVGKEADTKAQAIAARSYALARPAIMGNSGGTKLSKENGEWILQIRDCTNDQAYCDPDRGYPSTACSSAHHKLPEDSVIRKWVNETAGQVLVDNNGYIIHASYLNTDQNIWRSMGERGLDHNQILLQHYNNYRHLGAAKIVSMSCSDGGINCGQSTGGYSEWLQNGQSWSGIHLGKSSHTIASAGCLATSIAMLIAKSGVVTNVNGEFNPGTFVQAMNTISGFSDALLQWYKVELIAPNFKYTDMIDIYNYSKEAKFNKIKELQSNGYYVVAEVKGNTGQHWVAIDSISGNTINMMDPGSTSTNMWQEYNWKNTSRLAYFRVG